MKPGDMISVLHDLLKALPEYLNDNPSTWQTLDINYEPPRVERLWRQIGEYRLMLHCIYPCEEALFHPHPWPSAVHVVSGQYVMGVSQGHVLVDHAQSELARFELHEGSEYEMIDPLAWHYVRPIKVPSRSVMVIGQPWDVLLFDHSKFGGNVKHKPLADGIRDALLYEFRTKIRRGSTKEPAKWRK